MPNQSHGEDASIIKVSDFNAAFGSPRKKRLRLSMRNVKKWVIITIINRFLFLFFFSNSFWRFIFKRRTRLKFSNLAENDESTKQHIFFTKLSIAVSTKIKLVFFGKESHSRTLAQDFPCICRNVFWSNSSGSTSTTSSRDFQEEILFCYWHFLRNSQSNALSQILQTTFFSKVGNLLVLLLSWLVSWRT